MNLPRAVREQAERSEALHQALLANTGQPAPQSQVAAPPVEQVEPPTPAAPVAAAPPAPDTASNVTDSWELKYRVLNGKYTAEVPRLAEENRVLKERIRLMETAANAPQAPTAADAAPVGVTSKSVREQFGDEFADAVEAIARDNANKVRDEFSSEVSAVKNDAAVRSRREFISDLTRHIPNWKVIDADAGFTAYLDEVEAHTGRTRREFFNEADSRNDADRVASFFVGFLRAQAPAPTRSSEPAAPSVDHLIAPDSSRHASAPAGKKLWTRAEVQQFYADARTQGDGRPFGRYTAAEFARIDQDISAATVEGRYIG